MKIKHEIWTIKELIEKGERINPKPQYQRTSVWSPAKKQLLIDSILRGYDIPKFYLTETPQDPMFDFEVTDGQQRMRAIWEFVSDNSNIKYPLSEFIIENINTKGLFFDGLDSDFKTRLYNFKLNFSIITNTTPEENRTLFARLQMGEKLNPVELRHAIASNLGNVIWAITENHPFFKDCRIPNSRFKHQDYLDNIMTIVLNNGEKNIKAHDMRLLYIERSHDTLPSLQPTLKNVNKVLDFMKMINVYNKGMFRNKWAFVDTFYLLYQNLELISSVHAKSFCDDFMKFEKSRRLHNKEPEKLIEDKNSLIYDKDLYDYIIAFKTAGALKSNFKIRYRVFSSKFFNSLNFDIK